MPTDFLTNWFACDEIKKRAEYATDSTRLREDDVPQRLERKGPALIKFEAHVPIDITVKELATKLLSGLDGVVGKEEEPWLRDKIGFQYYGRSARKPQYNPSYGLMDILNPENTIEALKPMHHLSVMGKEITNWMKPLYVYIYYKDYNRADGVYKGSWVKPIPYSHNDQMNHHKWYTEMKCRECFPFDGRPMSNAQTEMGAFEG
jgi:hypothetical protein